VRDNTIPTLVNMEKSPPAAIKEMLAHIELQLKDVDRRLRSKSELLFHYSQRLDMLEINTNLRWMLRDIWADSMDDTSSCGRS